MEKKKKTIFLFFVLLTVISFLIVISPSVNFPKKIVLSLSKFPLKVVGLNFSPLKGVIICNKSLRQNQLLKKENQNLKIELMQLQEAQAENKRLYSLLSLKEKSPFSLVASRVIAFDASNIRKSLVIDKGTKNGVRAGNPVIVAEGVVGIVVEVSQSASRIMLINDLDFSMAAKVEHSDAIGIISGSLEGGCRLKYLDLDEDIKIGDEVISSGKNSRFPAGIPIGVITQISRERSGLTLFAVVKPYVKLSSIEEVLVIVNY